jgi:hypothetical protein
MLRRPRINPERSTIRPGLRSSLADAAFAVEERVLWRGGDGVKRLMDAARWPFERAAWALERAVIWPLEERTGEWSGAMRTLGILAAALLATAAGVVALVSISGGGDNAAQVTAPRPAPTIVRQTPATTEPGAPVLHGAAPDFTPEADGGVAKAQATTNGGAATADTTTSTPSSGAATASTDQPLGPEALKVARQFAGAFVLYETGADKAEVRSAFAASATPKLTHDLLQRPPRLPANGEVPRAKVLNVVPGPQHGDTYELSVSLLRVGVTSELRIEMQCDAKQEKCRVTDVRG